MNAITPADIFVSRLRETRERKGIPPEELASSLGLHSHVIRDWEDGKRYPRISSALRWAAALGVNLDMREAP